MTDDQTGEPLIQRSDDNVETLRRRLTTYHQVRTLGLSVPITCIPTDPFDSSRCFPYPQQTGPVVDFYRKTGVWQAIDASQSPKLVWASLSSIFGEKRK